MFYMRIAEAIPDLLSIVSVYTHSPERAAELRGKGIPAVSSVTDALSAEHDFAVVSAGREGFMDLMRKLSALGENILSETSFHALTESERDEIEKMRGAVAEQYMLTPLYASVSAALGMIGHPDQLMLSGLHNHHAAAVARSILGLGTDMPDEIRTLDFPSSIVRTGSRSGLCLSGEKEEYTRKLRILRFGDRLFINDFSGNQYHSYLYGKRIEVRGNLGVITENGVSITGEGGYPCFIPFVFHRDSAMGNIGMTLSHVTLGERTVFRNRFYPAPLNDDEIAIAEIISRMRDGESCPTLSDGIGDARLGSML